MARRRLVFAQLQGGLQQVEPGVFRAEGTHYNLILNNNRDQLSLQAKNARGEIARFSRRGEVQDASGLAGIDLKQWQLTQRQLRSWQRQNPDQSLDR